MAFASINSAYNQLPLSDEIRMTAGTASQVDSNVYIGGYIVAADPLFVKRAGITRIVKMFADTDAYPGGNTRLPGVKYLVIPAQDTPEYDIRAAAFAALRFIQEGIRNNEIVLVHCHAGVSRSATVVLLYLMVERGYSLDMAFSRLRMVRDFVRPNSGFMRHLRATDARLRRLRVGDEYRRVSYQERDRPFIAPLPVIAGAAAAPLRANRVAAYRHSGGGGGEPPGRTVHPIAPPGPRIPGDGLSTFADPYEDDTPAAI